MTRRETHRTISSTLQRIDQGGRGLLPPGPDPRDYETLADAYETLAATSSTPGYEKGKAQEYRREARILRERRQERTDPDPR